LITIEVTFAAGIQDMKFQPEGSLRKADRITSGRARGRRRCNGATRGIERLLRVLELHHNINSVCAQKVRIALNEKGQAAEDRIMTLRGDQYDPAYLKLNPNGVVPTLVHDGAPITESSLILYYIDEVFPVPPLMPKAPHQRYRVRMYNKLIDEYLHNSCTILTFATAFRPAFLKMAPEAWQAEINKAPLKRRAEYKRSVIEHGLDSEFVVKAALHYADLFKQGEHAIDKDQVYADLAKHFTDEEIIELGLFCAERRGWQVRQIAQRAELGGSMRAQSQAQGQRNADRSGIDKVALCQVL
jgi:glutathione S-transferase